MTTLDETIKTLVKKYNFVLEKPGKLPTIDYVYPDYTADGNSELFRYDSNLRKELSERAQIVTESLKNKKVLYTLNDSILLEIANIAPRLGLKEQILGEINSVYCYSPLLFIGVSEDDFKAYVVKPIIDYTMAWFELTNEETDAIKNLLLKKTEQKSKPEEKPYDKKSHSGIFSKIKNYFIK